VPSIFSAHTDTVAIPCCIACHSVHSLNFRVFQIPLNSTHKFFLALIFYFFNLALNKPKHVNYLYFVLLKLLTMHFSRNIIASRLQHDAQRLAYFSYIIHKNVSVFPKKHQDWIS
jgi:hypothetical protein